MPSVAMKSSQNRHNTYSIPTSHLASFKYDTQK
nr:MAG TPA: hypothetical protein [Caudoviricetes sp.]